MNAVIYARFSSDRQTEMSIDAQVRACTEYANRKGINIIRTYTDEAISGTTNKRPGYQEMLADAFNNEFDLILIHKYDRIARDLSEQVSLDNKLKSLNIRLIAVAQDYGTGKDADLTKGIQWVLGGYYSANLSEEVKKGHRETALKGLHNGGIAPFGYNIIDQKYVINPVEASYVKRLFSTFLAGENFTNIIKEMAAAGITGKRGKPIKYPQIYEILNNEKYTGTYVYSVDEETDRANRRSKPNAIRIENAIPAIIDKESFAKTKEILKSHKHAGPTKHRCSGLVYCAECGAKMHLHNTKRKGHEYHSFICSDHCGAHIVPMSFIDEAVDEYIKVLFSEKNIIEVESAIKDLKSSESTRSKLFKEDKSNRIKTKENEIKNIIDGLASGAFVGNYEFCNELLSQKRSELEALKMLEESPIEYNKVKDWLNEIVTSEYLPQVFISRIEANTTSVTIFSTFTEVVGELGCGGTLNIIPTTLLKWSSPSFQNP